MWRPILPKCVSTVFATQRFGVQASFVLILFTLLSCFVFSCLLQVAPVTKTESVNSKIHRKLGGLLDVDKEDEEAMRSRLRATRESRFAGATEDGNEVGEDYDFDVNFDNDETIAAAPEDEPDDGEELVPKKLSKAARKEMAKMKGANGEADQHTWVYELLYGDSDEESSSDSDKDDGGNDDDEDKAGGAGSSSSSKKRQREGAADEGRDTKKAKTPKPPKGIVQDEKFRRDRHSIITTLRSAFLNSPTLDSAQVIKVLRNAIPTFVVGTKPGLPAAEAALRDYWSYLLKNVLLEFTSSSGSNKFVWKEHQASNP
jgi:hypothetical protein